MKNATEIVLILDESGSMYEAKKATLDAASNFIKKQSEIPGDANITVISFSNLSPRRVLRERQPVGVCEPIYATEYNPASGTPLCDCLGLSIDRLGEQLSDTVESQRPDKIVFVVITDGEENSSREYGRTRVRSMIDHQKEKYSWEFIFIGSEFDVEGEGKSYGFTPSRAVSYNKTEKGTAAMMEMTSAKLGAYRSTGQSESLDYTAEEKAQLEATS